MKDAALWEPLLREGERLIWTGRPRGGWRTGDFWQDMLLFFAPVYVLVAWAGASSRPVEGAILPVVSLLWSTPAVVFGLYFYLDRRQRRQSRYAVTDRRALKLDAAEPDKPVWTPRNDRTREYAQNHFIWIGQKDAVSPVFTPGSFRDRAISGTAFRFPRHGERVAITFRDISDGFALLRLFRDTEKE